MLNKFLTAAAIILLLLLCFIGWLEYRQYTSWNIPVHKNIQTVARLNTDAFITSFIKEYGINFSKKIKKKEPKKEDKAKNTGIYFPGNIFVYNVSSRQASTFFCTLPVYDLDDFKAHVQDRFNIQIKDSAGIGTGTSADAKITIACNKEYISIAYSAHKEEVISILKEILSGKTSLSENNSITTQLKKANTHIAFTDGKAFSTVNMSGHQLLFHSVSDGFGDINIPPDAKQRTSDNSANASFFINAFPAASLFKKKYSIKQYNFETDSLLKYFNGYADFELGQPISQIDTITTYEYDDNFEKVEKQTLTEVKVPSIDFSIMAQPGLLVYLQRQEIVTSEMKLNKEIFPLYAVNVIQSNQMLHFTTSKGKQEQEKFKSTGYFLEVNMDVQKSFNALNIPYLQQYIKNISGLHITGKKEGSIVVDGSIDFKNSAIKEIVGMLKK